MSHQRNTFSLNGLVLVLVFTAATASATHRITVRCGASAMPGEASSMSEGRDRVRALQPLNDSVRVHIVGDCLARAATLELDPRLDSGSPLHTITSPGALAGQPDLRGPSTLRTRSRPHTARLLGALRVNVSLFQRSPFSDRVLQLDLAQIGFNSTTDLGEFYAGAYDQCGNNCHQTRAEVFVDGVPMLVARYPNVQLGGGPWMDWMFTERGNGYPPKTKPRTAGGEERTPNFSNDDGGQLEAVYVARDQEMTDLEEHRENAAVVLELSDDVEEPQVRERRNPGPNADLYSNFTVNSTRAARWAEEVQTKGSDVWVHGYWKYDWSDSYMQVKAMGPCDDSVASGGVDPDPESVQLWNFTVFSRTLWYIDWPAWTISKNSRFYILNLLSELDSPGEYFIHKQSNMLYFYPPYNLSSESEVFVSLVNQSIVSSSNVAAAAENEFGGSKLHDVVFEDLAVMYGRTGGIDLLATDRVALVNMNVSNVGHFGVRVGNASNTVIDNLASSGCGCSAVIVGGGDWRTLRHANTTIRRSQLTKYSRWCRTCEAGIVFSGVGINVLDNTIGNAPANGILGAEGNDYQNSTSRVVSRGLGGNDIVFRGNYLFDLCYAARDAGAFYVYNSLVKRGMVLVNNTFVNVWAKEPTTHGVPLVYCMYWDGQASGVNATGNACRSSHAGVLINGGRDNTFDANQCDDIGDMCVFWRPSANLTSEYQWRQLKAVNYQQPPYSIRYPRLASTMAQWPLLPAGTRVVGNTWCNVTGAFVTADATAVREWHCVLANNSKRC